MRHATNATFAVFKMMIENGGKCDKIIIYNIYINNYNIIIIIIIL